MKLRATLLFLFTLPLAATLLACASSKGAGAVERKRASSTPRPRLFVGPTFVTGDPALPEAKAVIADASGRILEVLAEVPADPSGYEVVRLEGALALPGLHDAHAHILGIGRARDSVDLVGATSVEEVVSRVEAFLEAHPDAAVVRGRGWDQSRFSENRFPTARDLAPLGDRHVFLTRVDGHAVWVNEAFLKLAGITKDTQDPDGGRIERDADGNPTGIFIDNAIDLVADKLPKPTDADYERWLVQGMNACADAGLVAVHDMGFPPRALTVLRKLDEEGRVPLRLFLYLDGSVPASLDALDDGGFSDRVHIMGVKLFADGAMGSRGAALLEPYSDDPKNRGLLLTEPKILEERVRQVHMRGKQAAIHAIGDRGNRVALEAIAGAQGDEKGRRHRIEHAQLVHPDDFEGFEKLGVVASMQPTHATSDMRWAEARVGPERLKGAYAWKTMLAHGVPLAFGSDAPVESERPTFGLYAALTRQDHEGKPEGGWRPEERLSFDEALAAFTQGAAYAVHREGDLGALTPGKLLDLTVLDRDPRGEPRTWLGAKATAAVVGGDVKSAGSGA